jgi:hypothetical protein
MKTIRSEISLYIQITVLCLLSPSSGRLVSHTRKKVLRCRSRSDKAEVWPDSWVGGEDLGEGTLSEGDNCRRCSRLTRRPDDGGSKHLTNVGQFLPAYTVQQAQKVIFILAAVRT